MISVKREAVRSSILCYLVNQLINYYLFMDKEVFFCDILFLFSGFNLLVHLIRYACQHQLKMSENDIEKVT
jgi:hypothetical protein